MSAGDNAGQQLSEFCPLLPFLAGCVFHYLVLRAVVCVLYMILRFFFFCFQKVFKEERFLNKEPHLCSAREYVL